MILFIIILFVVIALLPVSVLDTIIMADKELFGQIAALVQAAAKGH
jgi:hypothetical protein